MLKCLNVKKSKGGFSIIEMLVAVTIFTLVVGSATGLFVSAIRSQAKILATQKLLDEASYVMEYMGRYLRMAKKDTGPTCLNTAGNNYENPGGSPTMIRFINYRDECQAWEFSVERLSEDKDGGFVGWLTSEDLKVTSFEAIDSIPTGSWSETDSYQPRVTLSLTIQKKPEGKPQIEIQTTISQRDLDLK